MVDKNVTITTPADGQVYYFPGCHVYRGLDKTLQEIPLPKESQGLDLLMSTDGFRVTGVWKDDETGQYDGKTAFRRYIDFVAYAKTVGKGMTFSWSSGPDTETLNVMVRGLDFDKDSGDGKIVSYNIDLAIVKPTGGS